MNAKHLVVFSLLIGLCSSPAIAEDQSTYSAGEVRDAMVSALASIEEAAGLAPEVSQAIAEFDDEVVETLYSQMADKEGFIASAREVVARVEAAKTELVLPGVGGLDRSAPPMPFLLGTAPYPPNYPENAPYVVALGLGLVDSPDDRCGGDAYDVYEAVYYGAKETADAADFACVIAGCDPTGIACAVVCVAVEVTKEAVLLAGVPIRACQLHGDGVVSAEIEAGYENGVSTLSDLAAHDTNIDGDLAAHDANIDGDLAAHDANIDGDLATHDADIKALLANIVANQEEIIKLLKTPQGRRPGWGEEGY